ncbi:MAG: glycosyltransferase [Acidocella sp.]|nr:glycosyltransferase [Acidocella sp.]
MDDHGFIEPRAGSSATVTIILSTFNGQNFLRAQLTSLLTQSHENWTLFWRDDGSTDDTVAIMQEFAASLPAGRCVQSSGSGVHLGAAPSFLALLREAAARSQSAIAFADQDDVWLPEKLANAMAWLAGNNDTPALYCARQFLVNETLQNLRLSVNHNPVPGFPACLTQNIANGNTLVINARAASLIAIITPPAGTVHDWWSYIVVSACGGHIYFDEEPQLLYRLHKRNLMGTARPLPARALAALRRGPKIFMTMMRRHTEALAGNPGLLPLASRRQVKLIQSALDGSPPGRFRALSIKNFRRRTALENLLFGYWFLTATPQHPGRRTAADAMLHPAPLSPES